MFIGTNLAVHITYHMFVSNFQIELVGTLAKNSLDGGESQAGDCRCSGLIIA